MHQDKQTTRQDYQEKLKNSIQVIEHCSGRVADEPDSMKKVTVRDRIDPDKHTIDKLKNDHAKAKDQYLATVFFYVLIAPDTGLWLNIPKMGTSKIRITIRRPSTMLTIY